MAGGINNEGAGGWINNDYAPFIDKQATHLFTGKVSSYRLERYWFINFKKGKKTVRLRAHIFRNQKLLQKRPKNC